MAAMPLDAAPPPPPSYVEVAAGLMTPLGDDTYETYTDSSFKLALRVGIGVANHVAFELGGDWTPANAPHNNLFELTANRFRVLAGVRVEKAFAQRAMLFLRLGVGPDIVAAKATGTFLGATFERKDSDVGIALEVGGGVAVTLGSFVIGGQLALPIGIHFHGDDPNDPNDFNYDYTGVDLDFLGFVQTRF